MRIAATLALASCAFAAEAQLQRIGGIVAYDLFAGVDGQLYAGTETGIVRVAASGVTPIISTTAPVESLAQLPDGTFVFFSGNAVRRAAAGGTPMPVAGILGGFSGQLTTASDGAVWFSLQGSNPSFGRIDPNGTITTIPQSVRGLRPDPPPLGRARLRPVVTFAAIFLHETRVAPISRRSLRPLSSPVRR